MKGCGKYFILCFFLLLGVAYTQAFACKRSSLRHTKTKLYISGSTKYGKYSTCADPLSNGNEPALNIEDEEDENETKKQQCLVCEPLSNLSLFLDRAGNSCTCVFHRNNPHLFYNSAIYISLKVLRI